MRAVLEPLGLENDAKKKNFTVIVEGNIGCGKTTFLKYFESLPFVEVHPEPLHRWTNINGENALSKLYENSKRWAFNFNTYAQLTRLEQLAKPQEKPLRMIERSIYSTRYIFAENSLRCGDMNEVEVAVLDSWYQYYSKQPLTKVDLIVYLQASPEKCFARLQERHRKEESLVPFQLIQDLHQLHEDCFVHKKVGELPGPVLILNANIELPDIYKVYEDNRQAILCGAGL